MTRDPLHSDFVALIRDAWERQRVKSAFVGSLYWETEYGRSYCPPDYHMLKRLRRLAVTLNYHGPILQVPEGDEAA